MSSTPQSKRKHSSPGDVPVTPAPASRRATTPAPEPQSERGTEHRPTKPESSPPEVRPSLLPAFSREIASAGGTPPTNQPAVTSNEHHASPNPQSTNPNRKERLRAAAIDEDIARIKHTADLKRAEELHAAELKRLQELHAAEIKRKNEHHAAENQIAWSRHTADMRRHDEMHNAAMRRRHEMTAVVEEVEARRWEARARRATGMVAREREVVRQGVQDGGVEWQDAGMYPM